jgi:hypothetical protein
MRIISYNIGATLSDDPFEGLKNMTIEIDEQPNFLYENLGNVYDVHLFANGTSSTVKLGKMDWRLEFTTVGPMRAHYAHDKSFGAKTTND